LTIEFGYCSDIGRVRSENQDFFGKFPENTLSLSEPLGQLFVIADGMGGYTGGRKASELAVDTIHQVYASSPENDVAKNLGHAIERANEKIYEYGLNNPKYRQMGTTCSALVLKDLKGYIAHVGDSRIYRIGKRSVTQLTNDHSKVAEMERRGLLTPEEAKNHPERSQLYRACGVKPDIEIDIADNIDLGRREYFLMCTDGLHNHVEPDEMQSCVLTYGPREAACKLVELANERGGSDNITVLVIEVKGSESFVDGLFKSRTS